MKRLAVLGECGELLMLWGQDSTRVLIEIKPLLLMGPEQVREAIRAFELVLLDLVARSGHAAGRPSAG